jgi:hypothetical protein
MSEHPAMIRVWSEPELKSQLLVDPHTVLVTMNVPLPDGVRVRIVGSKGSPGDVDDPSLIQVMLERGDAFSSFFLPSPRSPCAQQAAYGLILSRDADDPLLEQRVRLDAGRALSRLAEGGVGVSGAQSAGGS